MAFNREVNVTKVSIGDFEIRLFVPETIGPATPQTGELEVQIVLSDQTIQIKQFDLLDRLGDDAAGETHLANLVSLRNYIKTRLQNEVLPT